MNTIYLVTGSDHKLREWQTALPDDIPMERVKVDLDEIQSANPEEIVADKVRRAYAVVGKPVVVEDVEAGLDKLNGLPGPFIKFFIESLGKDALYQLAGNKDGERATVSCTIGYYDGEELFTVRGVIKGTIVAPRGDAFGFDVTFIPDGETQTFSEMDPVKKNSLSHRGKAIELFIQKLKTLSE